LPVIMLTAYADSSNTIEAMKLGAFDHLTKPISREQVLGVLERALGRPRSATGEAEASATTSERDQLIGSSPAMREVHKLIGLAAPSDATVLVQGETGTGKEEVAHALHRHGARADKPFVAVNCAAIPAELLESELFGHVKGAFTGAVNPRVGRFSEANKGTLFLDEIGDMTLPMQAKILRVLQDRIVTPVGASTSLPVDVRIVAATHRDLIAMVRDGGFREDLFYRLSVVCICLPPLRERGADILVLAEHFLRQLASAGQPSKRLSTAASQALLSHAWPGNVRELRNTMQHATVTVRGTVIDRGDLLLGTSSSPGSADTLDTMLGLPWNEAIARLEKALLTRALRAADGNRTEAARRLDIHRQLLYAKLKEHKLGDEPVGSGE
jgi:DNA-binding NtrC family response regulator